MAVVLKDAGLLQNRQSQGRDLVTYCMYYYSATLLVLTKINKELYTILPQL
jgi:hypothetical protein